MNANSIELNHAELLTTIHNYLNSRFFAADKHDAKRLYKSIAGGKRIAFLKISDPQQGDVQCYLTLDKSEFDGKLGFNVFRMALAGHLQRVAERLRAKEDLNIYTNPDDGSVIYHLPGVIDTAGVTNVLVSGLRQTGPGELSVRLLFLNAAELAKASRKNS